MMTGIERDLTDFEDFISNEYNKINRKKKNLLLYQDILGKSA